MKSRGVIGFLLLLLLNGVVTAKDNSLNIYSWSNFLPESVIRRFQEETGIRVNHSTYASNEVLYAKLKASANPGYDIVIPSSYFISRMIRQNLIQKIDKTALKNLNNIDPLFLRRGSEEEGYGVPYLWSATGIIVNDKYYAAASVGAWKELWDKKFSDQLLMLDDTRELFSMALIALGYSVNDKDPQHIKEAFLSLKALMNNVKVFNTEAQRSIYLDEDITIGMGWNGDLQLAKLENPHLHFIYPQEGFVVLVDCLAIPTGAPHVANAHRFIDFVLRPENAKQISMESGFSTPNLAARRLLPEVLQRNETLYPSAKTLKRAKFQTDVGEAALQYEKYFQLLKLEK